MCNQNIFTAEIEDMHSLWQGISDKHFESSINCVGGRYFVNVLLTISVVKWKPNTKNLLVYKANHQASISALNPIL